MMSIQNAAYLLTFYMKCAIVGVYGRKETEKDRIKTGEEIQ